ncbi:MAG: hypothetical protein M1836_006941 [Candelina mexicana]|nr:MAG: hypothetical protein M1836_006941 [Candelina mexicana]
MAAYVKRLYAHPLGATCILCRYLMSTWDPTNAFVVMGSSGKAKRVERFIYSSTSTPYPNFPTSDNWDRSDDELPFLYCRSRKIDSKYHMCREAEGVVTQDIWIHQECLITLGATYQTRRNAEPLHILDVWELGKSLEPDYEPREKLLAAREHCALREGLRTFYLKAIFPQERFLSLPEELQEMIIDMIKPCAPLIVLGQSRRLIDCIRYSQRRENKTALRLSEKIYIRRIEFEGYSYISQISNSPLSSDAVVLHDGSTVQTLLILIDHLGVLDIQFFDRGVEELEIPTIKAPWYQFLADPEGAWMGGVRAQTNGLFLKTVHLEAEPTKQGFVKWNLSVPQVIDGSNIYRRKFIPLPEHVARHDSFESHCPSLWVDAVDPHRNFLSSEYPDSRSMKCVALDGNISGLTMCRSGKQDIVSFNAHCRKQEARRGQGESDANLTIYFPISAGEYITQAWVQEIVRDEQLRHEPVLVVRTNYNRSCTFGPCISQTSSSMPTSHSLTRLNNAPISALFHNDPLLEHHYWITHFGVSSTTHTNQAPTTTFDPHNSPPPINLTPPTHPGISNGETYKTSAPLCNIRGIQTCTDTTQPHHPIAGLLLHYTNNTREAVGQWRFDLTCSPLISDIRIFNYQTSVLNVTPRTHPSAMRQHQLPRIMRHYIKKVWFSSSACGTDDGQTTKQLKGTLQWWHQRGRLESYLPQQCWDGGGDFLTFVE